AQVRLGAAGRPRELKARGGGSRPRRDLAESADAEVAVNELRRVAPASQIHFEPGEISCPLTHPGEAAALLSALHHRDIALESVAVAEPSLDEVFFALTGHEAPEQEHMAGSRAVAV